MGNRTDPTGRDELSSTLIRKGENFKLKLKKKFKLKRKSHPTNASFPVLSYSVVLLIFFAYFFCLASADEEAVVTKRREKKEEED